MSDNTPLSFEGVLRLTLKQAQGLLSVETASSRLEARRLLVWIREMRIEYGIRYCL